MATSTLSRSERPPTVTQRFSARYRHWPFRCCFCPDAARERDELRAELARQRAGAERERDDLRTTLEARAAAIEEARADLRTRAERAEAEADTLRAELGRARGVDDSPALGTAGAAASSPPPRRPRRRAGSQDNQ